MDTLFLGFNLKLPLIISCMTGGSDEGRRLNECLARQAGAHGIGIGTGSIRVMLDHPETRSHFQLKKTAGDVPVLANIGAAQLANHPPEVFFEAARSIEADGIYVHLNAVQEVFQTQGDRNFSEWRDSVRRFIESSPVPVLIKETGAGIPPVDGLDLLSWGAAYVDVSGSGGTDWGAVERTSRGEDESLFDGWGYPTAQLLLAYRQIVRAGGESGRLVEGKIIGSGGLREPLDYAKALACGTKITASALPFIRAAASGGDEAVSRYIESIGRGIRAAMALSGSPDLEEFRKIDFMVPSSLADAAEAPEDVDVGDEVVLEPDVEAVHPAIADGVDWTAFHLAASVADRILLDHESVAIGALFGNDEQAEAAMSLGTIRIGASKQGEHISSGTHRAPGLDPIDHISGFPVWSISWSGGDLDTGHIGAIVGFGDGNSGHHFGSGEAGKPGRLLVFGSSFNQGPGQDLGSGDQGTADAQTGPAEFFGGNHHGQILVFPALAISAVISGNAQAKCTQVGHAGDDLFRNVTIGAVDMFGVGSDHLERE